MRRIALDAMGGDHAPGPELDGALAAVRERAVEVLLVGDEAKLGPELARRGLAKGPGRVIVRHASQVIAMDESPATAFRKKRDASMRVCFDLAVAGEADAVVSAGNSGAMLAGGLLVMKRLAGVDRPGIMTLAPVPGRECVVLDVGANTEVKPLHLVQFAVLGAAYARVALGRPRPRVGVLSNGEEESKGTELTREAHRLLREGASSPDFEADFVFCGYAEGRDFFGGRFDVIVTDGFTGNVALKTSEGTSRMIVDLLRAEVKRRPAAMLGALLMKPALSALKRVLDPDQHGGAPLLGVDGVVVLAHGSASARAIASAIGMADRLAGAGLAPALADAIARHRSLWTGDGDSGLPAGPRAVEG